MNKGTLFLNAWLVILFHYSITTADIWFWKMTFNVCASFYACIDHQHLTTFVLDRKEAMITVDDGIRKLKLLDAKGKVWTQDMILQVDDKAVSLVDLESKVGLCKWHSHFQEGRRESAGKKSVSRFFILF